MICSHLPAEGDVFSASQVCRRWRGVLISSPSLWTKFPCRHTFRTSISLERCKSMPIQLTFDQQSSIEVLEYILLRQNGLVSLTIRCYAYRRPPLHRLLALSVPSLERLHIYSGMQVQEDKEQGTSDIWQDFPPLRELFVSQYPIPISQLAAPNLIHLALEIGGEERENTIRSILDMLRGCPLLETILIVHTHAPARETTFDHSPVSLPNLHSIELGVYEVRSGLITYLRFPPSVTAGFRSLESSDVAGKNIPPVVAASSQCVLGGIDIRTITLASSITCFGMYPRSLVRFEGVGGSLEITFTCWRSEEVTVLLHDDGVLL